MLNISHDEAKAAAAYWMEAVKSPEYDGSAKAVGRIAKAVGDRFPSVFDFACEWAEACGQQVRRYGRNSYAVAEHFPSGLCADWWGTRVPKAVIVERAVLTIGGHYALRS
jgi:hypothetical protein